jgi:hypothetical protein
MVFAITGSTLAAVPAIVVWLAVTAALYRATGFGASGFVDLGGLVVLFGVAVTFAGVLLLALPTHWLLKNMGVKAAGAYAVAGAHLALPIGFLATRGLIKWDTLGLVGTFLYYGSLFSMCGATVGYAFRRLLDQPEAKFDNQL